MLKQLQMLDYIVIVGYLAFIAAVGIIKGKEEKNTEDFFLAGRSMSWVLVFFSLLATEISAITFIGVPEDGYKTNFFYLQMAIGSLIGRYLIAYILLPGFYEKKIDTIYGYLKNRYGSCSHVLSSIFFLITRIMASGVRLYATAIALKVATGWSITTSLSMIVIVGAMYTCVGGLKAVIWTELFQVLIFFGGALLALGLLLHAIPGGFSGVFEYCGKFQAETGYDKLQIFNLDFSFSDPSTLIVSVLFGCISTFAAIGADHDLAQRLLTCDKLKKSQKAIILTGYTTFPVVILFLFLGTCLFVFFKQHPEYQVSNLSSEIFPYYMINVLPVGISGLLISALLAAAMGSLYSAINALASTVVLDIYKPYINSNADDRKMLIISRASIIVIGIVLVIFALLCEGSKSILYIGFKLVSFTYGSLLGVFCLGMMSKRGSDKGNVFAMIFSTLFVGTIHISQILLIKYSIIATPFIGWSWYIIIGTFMTIFTGYCFKPKAAVAV